MVNGKLVAPPEEINIVRVPVPAVDGTMKVN